MTTREDWCAACDGVVAKLLDAAGITAPPVDALLIAQRLEWPVVWDRGQAGRARIHHLDGRPTLFVSPEHRPERLQWAVAHEIGEASAWPVCRDLGIAADELLPRQREELANQFAQRLLLPTAWFGASDNDLFALKARFATASHELIAWRWLDRAEPTIVTVFDHGELTRRRCNFAARTPAMLPKERECAAEARDHRTVADRTWPHGRCTAWAVHEPGWQREILRTTVEWD